MLFPSTLITSAALSSLDPFLKEIGHDTLENNPDIFILSDYSIESVRSISNFLSMSPYSHDSKVIIIPQADNLSPESQNTLLKNLEEPGDNNYFFLLTLRPQSLINTIISRCHLIKINDTSTTTPPFIFPTNTAEALLLSEQLSVNKELVLPLLENQIKVTSPKNFLQINKLIKATKMLKANLDPKTVLDFLFLN
jgi:DNA polymerase III delta prime subunit